MAGYIKITRLSSKTGTYDRTVTEYQVNYSVPGLTYVAGWDEAQLADFLRRRVPLNEEELDRVMEQLHAEGHATIGDVDIPETEASSMGMEMVPDNDI